MAGNKGRPGISECGPETAVDEIRFSAVSRLITPTCDTDLGASERTGAPLVIADQLELNAIALWMDGPDPIVFVTFDLLYVGETLTEAVVSALSGLPRENILVTASHTHSAPMTDHTKTGLGEVCQKYLDHVVCVVGDAMQDLLDPEARQFGALKVGDANADHSVNRRLFSRFRLSRQLGRSFNRVFMAPNPKGPRDELVTLLEVIGRDGLPRAVLWNYACHPVGLPFRDTISANYPGVVRTRLRHELGGDLVVGFLQGFSGDVRPEPTSHPNSVRNRLRRMVLGPVFGDFSPAEYEAWANSLADVVFRSHRAARSLTVGRIEVERLEVPASKVVLSSDLTLAFQRVSLGEKLVIVAVSAEMVVPFATEVRAKCNSRYVMPVGCIDTPFGYAVTEAMFLEGGYESGGFADYFSVGAVRSELPEVIQQGVLGVLPGGCHGDK